MKVTGMILILAALLLIGYWAFSGASLFTLQQVPVTEVDPLFGTEQTVWKDEFRPGLLPVIGPVAGGLIVVAGLLLWRGARRRPVAA